MNDINELYRPVFSGTFSEQSKANELIAKYQQISLCQSGKKPGFDIPAMWGHYANKGNGVCIVFNKQKLIERIEEHRLYHSKITYSDNYNSSIIFDVNYDYRKPFNQKQMRRHFFIKTSDWSYEQEYRVIGYFPNSNSREALAFGDAICGIILHNASDIEETDSIFNSMQFRLLSKIFPEDNIYNYGFFIDERNLRNASGSTIWSNVDWNHLTLNV